jgi:hypothetical protein
MTFDDPDFPKGAVVRPKRSDNPLGWTKNERGVVRYVHDDGDVYVWRPGKWAEWHHRASLERRPDDEKK